MLTRCIKVSKLKTSFIISRERKKKGGKFPVSSSSLRTRRIMKFRRKLVDCPDKGDQAGIKIYQKIKRSLLLKRRKKNGIHQDAIRLRILKRLEFSIRNTISKWTFPFTFGVGIYREFTTTARRENQQSGISLVVDRVLQKKKKKKKKKKEIAPTDDNPRSWTLAKRNPL